MNDTASVYLAAGISIFPLRLDGSKAPAVPSWNPYRQRFATHDEITNWFSRPAGIGIVCGRQSGGLEVIDFDDGDLYEPWRQLVDSIVVWLPVVETGGGGFHVLYRCDEISGNHKIAIDPAKDKKKTLIETRGEGGYIVAAGSPMLVHESGQPYVQTAGPCLPEVPAISRQDRLKLWQAARTFDRSGELKRVVQSHRRKIERTASTRSGNEPWHLFDQQADFASLLNKAGWKSRDGVHWTRPGKASGTSGTLRHSKSGDVVLVVFSSNAGFGMNGQHRTLSPSAFVAETQFNCDWKQAAAHFRNEVHGCWIN